MPNTSTDIQTSPGVYLQEHWDRVSGKFASQNDAWRERFKSVTLHAFNRDPKLKQAEPASLFLAVVEFAVLGIAPDGTHGALVSFRNRRRGVVEVVALSMYRGLISLATQHGGLKSISAGCVFEGDEFEYERGTVERCRHVVPLVGDRGEMVGAWSKANLDNGETLVRVLRMEDIEAARKHSRAKHGPWVDHYHAMAEKTAMRRVLKPVPMTPNVAVFLDKEERVDSGHYETPSSEQMIDEGVPQVIVDERERLIEAAPEVGLEKPPESPAMLQHDGGNPADWGQGAEGAWARDANGEYWFVDSFREWAKHGS